MREPLLAVDREVGDVADLAKRLHQVIGGISVIFDDQETHDESTVSRIGDFPYGRSMLDYPNHSVTTLSCPDLGTGTFLGPKRARGGEVAPPPLDQLRTGGGDGCRSGVDGWGRACARPPGSNRRRGRRMPAVRPHLRSGPAPRPRGVDP